jgi:ABC-type sugar transport system ATPase subunit
VIRLDAVSGRWREFAIRDITLEVKPGQYLAVVGPTGAGKTLLLELLLGIYQPDRGRVWIGGRDVTSEAPERRGIGMVYQDYLLFPHLTVEQNLEFGLRYGPDGESERKRKVRETAKLLGVEHLLARYESTLSGGEKQRVALGRALVTEPKVLLLDEPLSSLDRGTARRLRGELKALHAAKGLTTIHVTHDLSEARQLGDAIALIHEGELHAAGTPDDLLRRPPTLFAANFGGAVNLFLHPSGLAAWWRGRSLSRATGLRDGAAGRSRTAGGMERRRGQSAAGKLSRLSTEESDRTAASSGGTARSSNGAPGRQTVRERPRRGSPGYGGCLGCASRGEAIAGQLRFRIKFLLTYEDHRSNFFVYGGLPPPMLSWKF